MRLPAIARYLATLTVFLGFTRGARATIVVVSANNTQATMNNSLGSDVFNLGGANGNTAYYFGNADINANPLLTAYKVDLDGTGRHYFQAATVLPPNFTTTPDSELAYRYLGAPNGGATTGVNFSIYDVNQNGKPDTVFELNFGPDLNDKSDDRIVAYAYDTAAGGIDVSSAQATLLVPDPI